MKRDMVAFDCGSSPYRVILGAYDEEQITIEVISRISDYMARVHQYLYWDMLVIYQKLLEELKEAVGQAGTTRSIGICTWGVGSTPFDKQGLMIQNPLSYRSDIGAKVLGRVSEEQRIYLFRQTGVLCDRINSVNMIRGVMEEMQSIVFYDHKLFVIPDILNYLFTGCVANEPNELSAAQLMGAKKRGLGEEALRTTGIPSDLFITTGKYDTAIGMLHSNAREVLDISYDVPVVCVPSHDTATVVLAVPVEEDGFLFVSTGIWVLIGMELRESIINEEVRKRCLTNEVGVFNEITLLRNSAGIFIIQRIKKEYKGEHGNIDWEELNSFDDHHEGVVPLFPVNDIGSFNPVHMSDEIWNCLVKTGQASEEKDWGIIICGFQNSMALSFASVIQDLEEVSGKGKNTVYMVDEGSRNAKLCQMTADIAGKRMMTGGEESMSLGDLRAQPKYFEPNLTVREIKSLLGEGVGNTTYCRGKGSGEALKRYQKLEE